MKILHLADTHLGFRQFAGRLDPVRKLNQRECDVYAAWRTAIDTAIERKVEAVVHAGDLFDSARPSPRALAEALDGFTRLRDAGIPAVVIAGNHETPRFRSGGSVFEVLELDPAVLARAEFDYVALGHLHRFRAPQVNAVYPGSLERLDFADVEGDKALLEIDLAAGAGNTGFVTRHPLRPRALIDLRVDCSTCDPAAVLVALRGQLVEHTLDGVVVRVRLDAIERDVYHALDGAGLRELFAPCLHHVVLAAREGLRSGGVDARRDDLTFADWARDRVPAGLDAEKVVALAHGFLTDAAAAEADAEVAE